MAQTMEYPVKELSIFGRAVSGEIAVEDLNLCRTAEILYEDSNAEKHESNSTDEPELQLIHDNVYQEILDSTVDKVELEICAESIAANPLNDETGEVGTASIGNPIASAGSGPLLRSVSLASELSGTVTNSNWQKASRVGCDYQAVVPDLCSDQPLAMETSDCLLWDPHILKESEVEHYLRKTSAQYQGRRLGTNRLVHDDEQALLDLLRCRHNTKEALNRRSMVVVRPAQTMSLWSEEECRSFESGLKTYGKDFYLIMKNKLRARSVGDLVQFYYLWKKTERHDAFVMKYKLGKKKCLMPLGTMRLHG